LQGLVPVLPGFHTDKGEGEVNLWAEAGTRDHSKAHGYFYFSRPKFQRARSFRQLTGVRRPSGGPLSKLILDQVLSSIRARRRPSKKPGYTGDLLSQRLTQSGKLRNTLKCTFIRFHTGAYRK
jgi:hypothetical protein